VNWPPAGAVRVDTLQRGDRFQCMQGGTYTFERVDGALSGVYHVVQDDGFRTCFAGCAEVILLKGATP
jgi:hypothetical protein